MPALNNDPFYTPEEAAEYLDCSKSYVDKLRVTGGGPRFVRFGPRKISYRRSDLDEWVKTLKYRSTSEYGRL
ncbi:excisionase family DNA binding protein [Rhodoligotrophos appendicifer]|uniref:helix-turn-helix transcriptional regulator n=1 Tax=Rhodoligotrophos appendicifer TaxID=987056 RepID=UPI00147815E3|nr:helix-turn-helix domain-containing protein [Rhodoligotrophos appendicifer]